MSLLYWRITSTHHPLPGQPIAAVAADTPRAAEAAVKLIKVEYEPLPHVTGIEEAMQENAPRVFPGPTEQPATAGGGGAPPGLPQKGNVRGPDTKPRGMGPRGDVAQGLRDSDVVVEAEYRTQVQTHVPMETHGLVADWRDDGLTLYASTQHLGSVKDEAAELFELPKGKIRVVSDFTGGGFGAKYGIGNYGLLAIHLSRKAKAPVRMMMDRREEHVSGGNRPNSIQKLKLGAKRDGTLTAIQLQTYGSGGVAGGAGVGFCHSTLYACANVQVEQYDVFTNAGPCAAFRAPGQVQGIFSLEQAVDELAEKIGMDPLVLRGKIDVSGTDDSLARAHERKLGAERAGWSKRKPAGSDKGPIKRGMGFAQSQWLYLVHPNIACEVRVSGDGSVEAFCAHAGHRHGDADHLRAGGGRGVRPAPRGHRLLYRRQPLPSGARLRWQPRHQLPDARRSQRRVPLCPGPGRPHRPPAPGERGRHRLRRWQGDGEGQGLLGDALPRGGEEGRRHGNLPPGRAP